MAGAAVRSKSAIPTACSRQQERHPDEEGSTGMFVCFLVDVVCANPTHLPPVFILCVTLRFRAGIHFSSKVNPDSKSLLNNIIIVFFTTDGSLTILRTIKYMNQANGYLSML